MLATKTRQSFVACMVEYLELEHHRTAISSGAVKAEGNLAAGYELFALAE
jgi:hypothetical protein